MAAWLAIRAFLGKLPWQLYAVLAAIGALAILWSVASNSGKEAVKAEVAQSDRVAVEQAREADGEASVTVNQTIETVEQTNDEARTVADSSDDPLGDGLRRLRRN